MMLQEAIIRNLILIGRFKEGFLKEVPLQNQAGEPRARGREPAPRGRSRRLAGN